MEFVLQKLPALANGLNLSIRNPILIYSFLALYGLLFLMLTTYVHAKFRNASKALKLLQTEWHSAETKHSSFVDLAQQSLSKLRIPAPATVPVSRGSGIGFDLRNQILSMAKRGSTAQDIARTCGLQEGEVDVILGMARLQR